MQELIDAVIEQIIEDVAVADYTAIEEMLKNVDVPVLEAFLKEDQLIKLRG